MNDNELKEWQTQSVKHKVAMVLIIDGVSFSYTEEDGIDNNTDQASSKQGGLYANHADGKASENS